MIELIGIGKCYKEEDKDRWVLRALDATLPPYGLISIRGESGSGKSTLLNIISMQEAPDEGLIRYNGRNSLNLNEKEKEDFRLFEIGFIYQHFNLIEDMTAFDNVKLALDIEGTSNKKNKEKTKALFRHFKLEDLESKRVAILSGGEKQRIAFLRAISRNPSIILADEPTGALDAKNETILMDYLKEYSKNHLVLMVSHNQRVIKKYSDKIYRLEDGHLIDDDRRKSYKLLSNSNRKERGKHNGWMFKITQHRLQKDWKRNILSYFGMLVSTCGLLISLGFISSSKETLEKEKKNTLLYTMAQISRQQSIDIEDSPLSLVKAERPDIKDIEDILGDDVIIEPNYSYFLPSYSAYRLNGEPMDPVQFSPISDISLKDRSVDLVVEGRAPTRDSLEKVLVNQEFASLFNETVVNHEIKVRNTVTIAMNGISDQLFLDFEFYIAGVVEEFSFLNSPRVYYSNASMRSYLNGLKLENISKNENRFIDVLDILENSPGDSLYTSYSYNLFFNESNASRIAALDKEEGISVTYQAMEIANTFSALIDSFTVSLIPFLILILIGSTAITCFTSYSLYISKRKESAILHSLGCRREDNSSLLLVESMVVSLSAGVTSLFLSFPLCSLSSSLLERRIGISNIVNLSMTSFGVPYFPIVIVILLACLVPLLGTAIPNYLLKRSSLVRELADE